jgi:cysteine-rich repeat protein
MSGKNTVCLRRSSAVYWVAAAIVAVGALCECGGDVERRGGGAGGRTSSHAGADSGGAAGESPAAGSGGEEVSPGGSGGREGAVVVECPGGRLVTVTGPACGDGQLDVGEMCDDGNVISDDGCSSQCQYARGWSCPEPGELGFPCGNCVMDEGEGCDDGNQEDGDGCSARCEVEEGYRCIYSSRDLTGSTCIATGGVCGDGAITGSVEVCDDGNAVGGDGCSADCTEVEAGYVCTSEGELCQATISLYPHCGDGVMQLDEGETCDDGINDGRLGGCSAACQVPKCGDAQVQREYGEECDDGRNEGSYGQCMPDCTYAPPTGSIDCISFVGAFCGDGYVNLDEGETCDDGINDGLNGRCNPDCTPSREGFCGDGVSDALYEECDDGDTESCDGCSAMCQRETVIEG